MTSTAILAAQRARMLATATTATATAEHTEPLDPHGDEARGIDPDALYDQHREDHP